MLFCHQICIKFYEPSSSHTWLIPCFLHVLRLGRISDFGLRPTRRTSSRFQYCKTAWKSPTRTAFPLIDMFEIGEQDSSAATCHAYTPWPSDLACFHLALASCPSQQSPQAPQGLRANLLGSFLMDPISKEDMRFQNIHILSAGWEQPYFLGGMILGWTFAATCDTMHH